MHAYALCSRAGLDTQKHATTMWSSQRTFSAMSNIYKPFVEEVGKLVGDLGEMYLPVQSGWSTSICFGEAWERGSSPALTRELTILLLFLKP